MRRLLCAASLCLTSAFAQSLDGLWDAQVKVNGLDIPFRMEFSGTGSAISGSFFNGDQKVTSGSGQFDAIVVGGGHNGLVAAAYLGRAGLRTLVIEGNPRLGGPAATLEFMPGYFTTIANSPGSLEPKIVEDLELESHGLRWVRPDPTLVQPLDGDRIYVGWRDPRKNHAQLETYAPGEAARYDAFFAYLQDFADRLGI